MQYSESNDNLIIQAATQKTFVFDLDGTLIYLGKPLENGFEQALLAIKQAGHRIIFATGRSWRDFVPVVPEWCSLEPSVVFGGGLVVADGAIKSQEFLAQDDVAEIIAFLEAQHAHYLVDGHSQYYHPSKEHWLYSDILKISGQRKTHSVENLLDEGAYKVLVLDEEWYQHFQDFIRTRNLCLKFHFYDKCFDIMPSAVNKYTGLRQLELPTRENIFVFGNDHNDLELFEELPNSIMFGHHQELQKYAKIQIPYDDDLLANFTSVINRILRT